MTQVWKDDQATAITLIQVTDKSEDHEFKAGDLVWVSGITKGRGFQGVVKRHGFAGGPKTHGQKNRWRAPRIHRSHCSAKSHKGNQDGRPHGRR